MRCEKNMLADTKGVLVIKCVENTSVPCRTSPSVLVLHETQRLESPQLNILSTQGDNDLELN